MKLRMSYRLTPAPPKPQAELEPEHEGLTDILVMHSVVGIPGGPGGLLVETYQLGPDGVEPLHPFLAVTLATMLLARAVEDEYTGARANVPLRADVERAAREALAAIRAPFRRGPR